MLCALRQVIGEYRAPTGVSGARIDQPAGTPGQDNVLKLRARMHELERERIREALERCAGNQTQAAELLGISRRTLVTRLTQYGLPRPRSGR